MGLPRLSGKEFTCQYRRQVFIPGVGMTSWEGNEWQPLKDTSLGSPMDRGAWHAASPWGCKRVGCGLATNHQQ